MQLSSAWANALLWIAFLVYWNAAARNVAATLSTESPRSRRVHLSLFCGCLLLALAVRFPPLNRRWLPTSSATAPIGLTIQASSFLLAAWARCHLGRNWSGAIAIKVDHQPVRTGPLPRPRFILDPLVRMAHCPGSPYRRGYPDQPTR